MRYPPSPALPAHVTQLDHSTLRDYAARAASHTPLGKILRCWQCFRTHWIVWDHVMMCTNTGSCHTYYAWLTWELDKPVYAPLLAGQRAKCKHCKGSIWQVYPGRLYCVACHHDTLLSWTGHEVTPLLDGVTRQVWLDEKILSEDGRPTWDRAMSTQPWKPRADSNSRKELLNKLRKYRRWELQKTASGRDVNIDYRKLKEVR